MTRKREASGSGRGQHDAGIRSVADPSSEPGQTRVGGPVERNAADHGRNAVELTFGLATGLVTLALYLRTLAPSVLAFDSGEFQFVVPTLGLAHPTGYPLYILLAKIVTLLPVGDVAYRVNLFSAVAGSVAVGLTPSFVLRIVPGGLAARRIAGLVAAGLTAVSFEFWSQAVIAEVYTLQLALLALICLAVVCRWPLPIVGLIAGFALAHHRASILSLPLLAVYLAVDRGRSLRHPRQLLLAAGLFLAPLLLYLYIPLRAPASPYLNQTTANGTQLTAYQNTLEGFIDEVTGRVFAEKVGLTGLGSVEERLEMFRGLLGRQWNYPVVLVAAIGAVTLVLRRWQAALLVVGIAALTIGFGLFYRIGDVEVYFIPAYWAIAILAGATVAVAAEKAPFQGNAAAGAIGAVAAALLVVPPLIQNFAPNDMSAEWSTRRRWETILAAPIEPKAILASDDRDDVTPLWYFQLVEGRRPDIVGAFPGMLDRPDFADLGRLVDGLMSPAEHIYLVKEMPGLDAKYRIRPEGPVWFVAGPAAEGAPGTKIGAPVGPALELDGADLPTLASGSIEVRLWWMVKERPNENYTSFVHLVDWRGQLVAQSDAPPGGVFYPTGRWRPGERLIDRHVLSVPDALPSGRYVLQAGMYGPDLRRLKTISGDTVELGAVRRTVPLTSAPAKRIDARFARAGTLEGVTIDPGGKLQLFWAADGPTDRPLTVFVHLVDLDGRIVRQADGPPASGALPSNSWLAGERFIDERAIPEFRTLPSGEYRLFAGLYDSENGQRRNLINGGDSVDLGLLRAPG